MPTETTRLQRGALDVLMLVALAVLCYGGAAVLAPITGVRLTSEVLARLSVSFGFITVAVFAGGGRFGYGRLVLAGLVCGYWGDFWLCFGGWDRFLAGLLTFLAGHLLYALAFRRHGSQLRWAGVAFGVLLVPGALLYAWFFPQIPGALHAWVLLYMVVISLMCALAVGAIRQPGGRLMAFGACAFWVSDGFVGYTHFLDSSWWAFVCTGILYMGAQYTLAASIAVVRRHA